MRDAPSIDIIRGLVKEGCNIRAFCPKGMEEAAWRLNDLSENIVYAKNEYDCANNVDALVLITEWNEFRGMNLEKIRDLMCDNYFFDLRNVFANKNTSIDKLFKYFPLGLKIKKGANND